MPCGEDGTASIRAESSECVSTLGAEGWLGIGGLPLITLAMAVYFVGCGLIIAQATAGALAPLPQMAGTAAALLGCIQMLTAMFVNALSSVLFDGSERPMVIITATCALGGLGAYAFLMRHRLPAQR